MGSSLSLQTSEDAGIWSSWSCCAVHHEPDSPHDEGLHHFARAGPVDEQVCTQPSLMHNSQMTEMPLNPPTLTRPSTSASNMTRITFTRPSFSLRRTNTSHSARTVIGAPQDFRKINFFVDPAAEFSLLDLGPALSTGRLSPLPDFAEPTWHTTIQDEEQLQASPVLVAEDTLVSTPAMAAAELAPQEAKIQTRPRAQTEPARPVLKRKRSGLLLRDRSDVDDEIRELEAIVEEKRNGEVHGQPDMAADEGIGLARSSSRRHVPAIAPSMQMRVRTKTLSDIGSAFSRPFSAASSFGAAPADSVVEQEAVASTHDFCSENTIAHLTRKGSNTSSMTLSARLSQMTRWLSNSRRETSTISSSATATGTGVQALHTVAEADSPALASSAFPSTIISDEIHKSEARDGIRDSIASIPTTSSTPVDLPQPLHYHPPTPRNFETEPEVEEVGIAHSTAEQDTKYEDGEGLTFWRMSAISQVSTTSNASFTSIASTNSASTSSTVSTSAFPTAPTTPPLSRKSSRRTTRSTTTTPRSAHACSSVGSRSGSGLHFQFQFPSKSPSHSHGHKDNDSPGRRRGRRRRRGRSRVRKPALPPLLPMHMQDPRGLGVASGVVSVHDYAMSQDNGVAATSDDGDDVEGEFEDAGFVRPERVDSRWYSSHGVGMAC